MLFLCFSAALSAGVGYGFYSVSLNWFTEHKGEEKITALQLVDAFVSNYSELSTRFGSDAPVPATFRAHSIELFNEARGADAELFRLRWVGRIGRQIATPPSDGAMAATIESFAEMPDPKPVSNFLTVDGQFVFRTVYPSLARQQSCVDCHNTLQPGMARWQLNDVMGAFSIDVPVGPFLHSIRLQAFGLSLALFLGLGGVSLYIARANFRQISRREADKAAIQASEEKFRDFAESASDWFWEEDETLRFIALSDEGPARGFAGRIYQGKTLHEIAVAGANDEQWRQLAADKLAHRPFQNFRFQIVAEDGTLRHISISGKPIFDAEGRFRGYRGTGRNIGGEIAVELELARRVEERTAELHAAQHALLRRERLSALGQLTATVAHELRNPLSAIRNTVYLIRDGVAKAGMDLERPITRIERNIARCDRIINDLLDYTRIRELQRSLVPADHWVHETLGEQTLPDGVTLVFALGASGCRLNCDVERMRRVLVNLVENAAQALAELDAAAPVRRITVSTLARGDRLELAIEDTGPGIPEDVLPKVFEPLFSTKSFGTGLGLPTVKQIVELHGGSIEITSAAGRGTRVVVLLPISSVTEIAA